MKIYKFSFHSWNKKIVKEVLEVEEKPKTYMTTSGAWKTRINKSDIDRVNTYDNVYLLEDDEKKARSLFCDKLKSTIQYAKDEIQRKEKEIAELENTIKYLSQEA